MASSILNAFNGFFEMLPAVTAELKDEVYKLRYQVYCIETKFESPESYPDFKEYDCYDAQSVHYLIRHRKTGIYVATTRLIIPDVRKLADLPIEKNCIIDNIDFIKDIPRDQVAEVSRFCVSRECKKRKQEYGTLTGIGEEYIEIFGEDERRIFPHISIALLACLVKISSEKHINYWYAVMEPSFLRFLRGLGINSVHIGPLTSYHGQRQPCAIKVSGLLAGVAEKNHDLWAMLTNEGQFTMQ